MNDDLSISELGEYFVRFVGDSAQKLRWGPPIESLPNESDSEMFGLLGRPSGLGVLRLEITGHDGELRWRRDLVVRPAKFEDQGAFESMMSDLCKWRTALALDLHGRSSAPWVWSDATSALAPEERLIVLRAAVEDNQLYDNIERIERSALVRLHRSPELVAIGREEPDAFHLSRFINGPGARRRIPAGHPLAARVPSIPSELPPARKIDTVDTPENQFVKAVIRHFRRAAADALRELPHYRNSPLVRWGIDAEHRLGRSIASPFFSRVSWPAQVSLGNPALQGRAGYRSVLRAFLDVRAGFSMPWDELRSAVFGETRDVPTLYEFWCLVKLREALELELGAQLDLNPFLVTSGRLSVRRGAASVSQAAVVLNGKQVALTLHYNRTFQPLAEGQSGGFETHGSGLGTWSKSMKPDFTVSLYPANLTEIEAANQKVLRMIHFDAKYRITKLPLADEVTHVPDDVDKMHAYVAAINHSCAAYALFPGSTAELFAAPTSLSAVGAVPLAPGQSELGPALRLILERASRH
ncbi:DUF2357 domain-containing protein [Mesorhizobium dulcispinae]|uniref:DUF2357 domain-containing protein n=1 Tax=Mesorhizobium dulcispinae TaxID=3072316 RepID=UPI002A24B480|nr:DUF2357 domain-containing protein [Mesorhizobium sp. VK23D]MDX8518723.1 DUF2357 domain-containing protein [Mesorhizobium sp. VK23D]